MAPVRVWAVVCSILALGACAYRADQVEMCPVSPPMPKEICGNWLDDDCNGMTDEGCECDPNDPRRVLCGNNTGACRASMVCGANGKFETCKSEVAASQDDPERCGESCTRCAFPNARATCEAGVCKLGACADPHVNLDGNVANGCEYVCPVTPRAPEEICGNRVDDDCNGKTDEGCECDPNDSRRVLCGDNAGACRATMVCGADGKLAGCQIEVGPSQTDPLNCGACGNRCAFANAGATCAAGACKLGSCDDGYANIDAIAANGCEYLCPVRPAVAEVCGNRLDDDCDGRTDEDCDCDPNDLRRVLCGNNAGACRATMVCAPNGKFGPCQVDVGPSPTDPLNCGACGNRCAFANAGATCVAGACKLGPCDAGYANLDGIAANGCEYLCPVRTAVAEICGNRLDDDCDGRTDEDCDCDPNDPRRVECGNNVGTCRSSMMCGPNGRFGACESQVAPAPFETCNGFDEDCNGKVDDNCVAPDGGAPSPDGGTGVDASGPAPPLVPFVVQSNTRDPGSHAQSVVCGKEDGITNAYSVVCARFPDGQFPYAQCIVEPPPAAPFDLDAFDADNQGKGVLEVRFCVRSVDGGPITGSLNLWYGPYPRRKVLKLIKESERQGLAPGCYVRSFRPQDADVSRFLVATGEKIVLEQIPEVCRFKTATEAAAYQFNGKWTSLSPQCAFSYKDAPLWLTAESCVVNVQAEVYRLGVTYFPDALKCAGSATCPYADRPRCALASDAPMCAQSPFYCDGLCQASCDGAGMPCEVHKPGGVICMSTIQCVNGGPVCPISGCGAAP